MKKFKFLLVALVLVSLFFTSCAKQEDTGHVPAPDWGGGIEKPDDVEVNPDGHPVIPDVII